MLLVEITRMSLISNKKGKGKEKEKVWCGGVACERECGPKH